MNQPEQILTTGTHVVATADAQSVLVVTLPCQRRWSDSTTIGQPDGFYGDERVSLVMVGKSVERVLCDQLYANTNCSLGQYPCYMVELDGDQ